MAAHAITLPPMNSRTIAISLFVLSLMGTRRIQAQAPVEAMTLQQCLDTALVHNAAIRISAISIQHGQERILDAKSNILPKVTANADYRYFSNLPYQLMPTSIFNGPVGQFKETQFGVPHNISTQIQVSWPLFNPQIKGGIQVSQVASDLTKLQARKTQEQVYFDVSSVYYSIQILQNQLDFLEHNYKNAEKLLSTVQLVRQQLMAKETDVEKIKLQLAQLSTQKETISNKISQLQNNLKFAMGIALDRNIQISTAIVIKNQAEFAMTSPVEIQLSEGQNQLLATEVSTLEKSRHIPTLSLMGSYGSTGFGYDQHPNDFLKFFPLSFIGLQMSYPLYNGPFSKRKILLKKLEIQSNEIQTGIIEQQMSMQEKNARLQKQVAGKTIETSKLQMTLASHIYDQTSIQQKQGTANVTDILLAENALREAQQAHLSAIIDYLKADLELQKITGNISTRID